MYCRKCGAKLNDTAKFCDSCGEATKTVKQRSDSQKYADRKEKKMRKKTAYEKEIENLKNPYVTIAFITALIAFGLGIFPWPVSWQIGTSLWMRILILIIALLSDYHCTKAKQVNRLYDFKYCYQIKPKMVTTATVMSSLTTAVALFALITK